MAPEQGLQKIQIAELKEHISRLEGLLDEAQRTETFYRQILHQVQEGVIVQDGSLHVQFWNPAMERKLGLKSEDILGRHVLDVLPQTLNNGAFSILKRALGGETIYADALRFINPVTENVQWHASRFTPLRNDAGMVIGVIITVRDVTAQKLAEAAWIDSTMQLRLALNNAQHGLWDWDITSGYIYYDDNWGALLGYLPGELDTRIETWRESVHPEDLPVVRAVLERHLKSDDTLYEADYRPAANGDGFLSTRRLYGNMERSTGFS